MIGVLESDRSLHFSYPFNWVVRGNATGIFSRSKKNASPLFSLLLVVAAAVDDVLAVVAVGSSWIASSGVEAGASILEY